MKTFITLIFICLCCTLKAQPFQSAYPRATGYFSVLYPIVTWNKNGVTNNFEHGSTIGFPFGINIAKSDNFAVSFEFTPTIRTQGGTSKVAAVLFNPGATFKFSHGFSFTQRVGFETSGRFGFSEVLNKVLIKGKDHSFFASVPFPVRFGAGLPASIGSGLLFGVSF